MTTKPVGRPPIAGAARRIRTLPQTLVEAEPMFPDRPMPLVVRPRVEGVDLAAWAADNRDWFLERLHRHGAILMTGFGAGVDVFEGLMRAVGDGELLKDQSRYDLHTTTEQVYLTTHYPSAHEIYLHNETFWQYRWPRKICFCAQVVPEVGGATTFADARRILARLPDELLESFRDGVLYVRNHGSGLALRPWQHVFGAAEREQVEEFCRGYEVRTRWHGEDRLTTSHLRPAMLEHPVTGDPLWFNHILHAHISTNTTPEMAAAVARLGPDEVPTNVFHADGSPIPDAVIALLREAHLAESVVVPWQQGDVLVLDNMLAVHGRQPYEGDRRVLVGMTELTGWPVR
jgi:alpha-ketoglutarate-dependent taurine dioxygenase